MSDRQMPIVLNRLRACSVGLAVLLTVVSCMGPVSHHPAGSRIVVVHNTSGNDLWLFRATRDDWAEARSLGGDKQLHLNLVPGRYALGIAPSVPAVPLPLPAEELGFSAPESLTVTVGRQPVPEDGWCWIPAGPCLLGDDLGVGQEDERPVTTPHLASFWLAAHETTNAQFTHFLNALGEQEVDPAWLDLQGRKCRIQWSAIESRYTTDAPKLPVVTVSHSGASAYCQWLTRGTNRSHRLPTEAEWEKAARGPGSRVYAYGDTCRTLAANQESGRVLPVGSFAASGFGLFDMTGNAFEWTKDVYRSGRANADDMSYRSLRGGSFVLDGIFLRNSMRMRLRPSVRADDVGFRVLREAPFSESIR